MAGNQRKDYSIRPLKQSIANGAFSITDSPNIDFTYINNNLTGNLTPTGITAGTYGSPTLIPVVTLDIYGRVTGISTTTFLATGILLQTDGITNATQTTLNLVSGTNMAITDDGLGNITFDASGGGGPATWGSITGTLTSQTDLINYLTTNYYPLTGNPSGFLTTAVTSVAATVPTPTNPAFSVNVPNPTTTPSIDITANGIVSQYIRGDGSLANFPSSSGGGSSVSYYLNGSVPQGTFGGSTYYQMSKTPVLGGGTTFTRLNSAGNGLIAQFITDANDPSLLSIPGGNWNLELFFRATSNGGSPSYYVELYKYDTIGLTFTLIATDVLTPEGITNGTVLDAYFTALAVPTTPLALTDRLALRVFVNTSGRTIELHTENGHLCQIITTFTTGITALNGLTDQVQNFAAIGVTGLAPNWNSVSPNHTLNIPLASAASVTAGLISKTEYDTFNGKLSSVLANTNIFVGNASNIATAVAMSGDATVANTGALTIANNAVTYAKMQAVSAVSKLLGSSSTTTPVQEITLGTNLSMSGTTLNASGGGVSTGAIVFQFDGAGGVIPLGQYGGYYVLPYNFLITSWRLLSTTRGTTTALNASIIVDTYSGAAFPNTTSIWGGSKPTLTTASSSTATGLSINLTAGNLIGFNVDFSTLGQLITLTLIGTKS